MAPATPPARLLPQRPDEGAMCGTLVTGKALGLFIGAPQAIERHEPVFRRKSRQRDRLRRLAAHPANSDAAAVAALFSSGAGKKKNSRVNRLVPAITSETSPLMVRSSASTGSSKYITLMMRR